MPDAVPMRLCRDPTRALGSRMTRARLLVALFEQNFELDGGEAAALHVQCKFVKASGVTRSVARSRVQGVAFVCKIRAGDRYRFLVNPFPELFPPTHEIDYT